MNRYVKKPIAIEAVKWKGFNNDEIKDFAGDSVKIEVIREGDADNGIPPSVDCSIETLEGVMKANVGDYIIKGVNGEFYPCKQDIFEKTYLHEDDMGNVSDGYHTFNELYKYRMLYNAAFFNELAKGDIKVCKSYKHYDGEECFGGGWFIVMAELPTGQISNHYENRYWELFNIPELDTAWEWDGHTPNEAADYYIYIIGVIVNASSNGNRLASLTGIGCYTITTCYKITLPSYTIVTCNLIIKFRHVSKIDDLLRIGYLRYRSKFSYPMPV